ncbi:hypothetical protein E2320_003925, partial [Naja naja]
MVFTGSPNYSKFPLLVLQNCCIPPLQNITLDVSLKGLALINGTQMITSLGCEAVERASAIARQADIVAALTLEVLKGTTKAFDT